MAKRVDTDVLRDSQKALFVIFILAILAANAFLVSRLLRRAGARLLEMPSLFILAALSIGDILLALFLLVVNARTVYEEFTPRCSTAQLANVYGPFNNFVFCLGLIVLVVEILLRSILPQNLRVFTSLVCGGIPYIAGLVIILPLRLVSFDWEQCHYRLHTNSDLDSLLRRFQAEDVLCYLLLPVTAFSASLFLMVFKGGKAHFPHFMKDFKPEPRNGIILSTWDPQSGQWRASQGAQPLLPQSQPYAYPWYPGQPPHTNPYTQSPHASGQIYASQPKPQIAQPNPQTAQPNPQTAQPNPQTALPNPQTAHPNPQTALPSPQTAYPNPQTAQPDPQTIQPNPEIAQPTAQTYIPEPSNLNKSEAAGQLASRREKVTLVQASFTTMILSFPLFMWLIAYLHNNDRSNMDPVPRIVIVQFCMWFSILRAVVTPLIFACRMGQPSE